LELAPDIADFSHYLYRADDYKKLGQLDKAIEDINKAIELMPEETNMWVSRAEIYEAQGEYAKAVADCNKALELYSANKKAKVTLARCEEALKAKPTPAKADTPAPAGNPVCPKCGAKKGS